MTGQENAAVSVVMTTCNGGAFLRQQLQSLAAQSRQPEEVLILDDGSRDDTVQLIRSFIQDKPHWRLVENRENLGYIRNFRKGLGLARGEILFLCDQDDVWEPDKIKNMTAVMGAEVLALACGCTFIDASGRPLNETPFYTPRHGGLSAVEKGPVLYENMAQGCACAYRRSLVEEYLQTPETDLPHDWALNFLAYRRGGLYFLDQPLLRYRLHGGNTTGGHDPKAALTQRIPRLEAYCHWVEDLLRLPLDPWERREVEAIASFTNIRIRWLRERKLGIWLTGAASPIWRRYFFRQYGKDLALGAIPRLKKE